MVTTVPAWIVTGAVGHWNVTTGGVLGALSVPGCGSAGFVGNGVPMLPLLGPLLPFVQVEPPAINTAASNATVTGTIRKRNHRVCFIISPRKRGYLARLRSYLVHAEI